MDLPLTPVETDANGLCPACRRAIELGCYVDVPAAAAFALESFTLARSLHPPQPVRAAEAAEVVVAIAEDERPVVLRWTTWSG